MTNKHPARFQRARIAAFILAAASPIALADFTFDDFSNFDMLNMMGDTATQGQNADLTLQITNDEDQISSIWYSVPQPILGNWSSEFTFSVSDVTLGGADGFAFVVQNTSATMHNDNSFGRGGGIGYNEGENLIAVEFDFWKNDRALDPNDNHISIHSGGPASTSSSELDSIGIADNIPDLDSGDLYTVRVDYTPGTMTVSLDGQQIISASVDLDTALDVPSGEAWVGFTGTTTRVWQTNELHNWSFVAEPVPAPSALAAMGIGLAGLASRRRR